MEKEQKLISEIRLCCQIGKSQMAVDKAIFLFRSYPSFPHDLEKTLNSLFSDCFKAVIDPLRKSLAVFKMFLETEQDPKKRQILQQFQKKAFDELYDFCNQGITLIEEHLLPHNSSPYTLIWLQKAAGDLNRYISEYSDSTILQGTIESAQKNYENAFHCAEQNFLPSHPLRLGVVLNYSIFIYEHLHKYDEAIKLLQTSVRKAEDELNQLTEQDLRSEALDLMEAFRANLVTWADEN